MTVNVATGRVEYPRDGSGGSSSNDSRSNGSYNLATGRVEYGRDSSPKIVGDGSYNVSTGRIQYPASSKKTRTSSSLNQDSYKLYQELFDGVFQGKK